MSAQKPDGPADFSARFYGAWRKGLTNDDLLNCTSRDAFRAGWTAALDQVRRKGHCLRTQAEDAPDGAPECLGYAAGAVVGSARAVADGWRCTNPEHANCQQSDPLFPRKES